MNSERPVDESPIVPAVPVEAATVASDQHLAEQQPLTPEQQLEEAQRRKQALFNRRQELFQRIESPTVTQEDRDALKENGEEYLSAVVRVEALRQDIGAEPR